MTDFPEHLMNILETWAKTHGIHWKEQLIQSFLNNELHLEPDGKELIHFLMDWGLPWLYIIQIKP